MDDARKRQEARRRKILLSSEDRLKRIEKLKRESLDRGDEGSDKPGSGPPVTKDPSPMSPAGQTASREGEFVCESAGSTWNDSGRREGITNGQEEEGVAKETKVTPVSHHHHHHPHACHAATHHTAPVRCDPASVPRGPDASPRDSRGRDGGSAAGPDGRTDRQLDPEEEHACEELSGVRHASRSGAADGPGPQERIPSSESRTEGERSPQHEGGVEGEESPAGSLDNAQRADWTVVSSRTVLILVLAVVARMCVVTIFQSQSIIMLFLATEVLLFYVYSDQTLPQGGPLRLVSALLSLKGVPAERVKRVQQFLGYLAGAVQDLSAFLFVFLMLHAHLAWSFDDETPSTIRQDPALQV